MRLFIAIQLSEEMKQLVGDVQNAYRRSGVQGNYTPKENLHLTLAFIGEYGDPDEVLEAMERVSFAPFAIRMDRLGCFGDLQWAGIGENAKLEALVRKLRHALSDAGIPYDKKRFKAHITYLRQAKFPDGKRIMPAEIEPAGMQVTAVSLMRSTRGKNGMIYTELGTVGATIPASR